MHAVVQALVGVLLCLFVTCTAACSRGASYELNGQIVAIDAARQELTIKHSDIKGFMPGMTMAFKVKERALMDGREPGEVIRATLVVEESLGYLSAIEVTGRAALTDPPPARPAFDLLEPGQVVPDAALIDQDGTARSLSAWRGRVLAVTFIYTRCPVPDFCPLLDRQFAAVQGRIAADRELGAATVHLISVSVDPVYDTAEVLRAHARRAGAQPEIWSFVTGEGPEIERFSLRFGVSVLRADPKGADIVHSLRTAVIDREGRLVKVFGGNEWTVDELAAEIARVARGQ